jgi:hypothetical protein
MASSDKRTSLHYKQKDLQYKLNSNYYKTFFVSDALTKYARLYVTSKHLIVGAYPSGARYSATLYSKVIRQ